MKQITFNKKGHTIIPDGYKWCEACEALTPYYKKDRWGSYRCQVCDNFSTGMIECPNCGCEENEDCCESHVVTKHHDGCHQKREESENGLLLYSHAEDIFREFKSEFMWKSPAPDRGSYCLPRDDEWYDENKFLHKKLKDYEERTKCECPKFTIYSVINQIVIDSGSGFNGDYTDYWWRYKVRCRVCGFIYENSGSS